MIQLKSLKRIVGEQFSREDLNGLAPPHAEKDEATMNDDAANSVIWIGGR